MEACILCEIISQRISPEYFQLQGSEVIWNDSSYDTIENNNIVTDCIDNYSTYVVPIISRIERDELKKSCEVNFQSALDEGFVYSGDNKVYQCNEKWQKLWARLESRYKQLPPETPIQITTSTGVKSGIRAQDNTWNPITAGEFINTFYPEGFDHVQALWHEHYFDIIDA